MSAFNAFDKDQNGSIAIEDFRGIIENLGEKLHSNEIREIMNEADIDGDGTIDYMEFIKMMVSK